MVGPALLTDVAAKGRADELAHELIHRSVVERRCFLGLSVLARRGGVQLGLGGRPQGVQSLRGQDRSDGLGDDWGDLALDLAVNLAGDRGGHEATGDREPPRLCRSRQGHRWVRHRSVAQVVDRQVALSNVRGSYPLDGSKKACYARLSVLKNRSGMSGDVLFVYEKAIHRFVPVNLEVTFDEEE